MVLQTREDLNPVHDIKQLLSALSLGSAGRVRENVMIKVGILEFMEIYGVIESSKSCFIQRCILSSTISQSSNCHTVVQVSYSSLL